MFIKVNLVSQGPHRTHTSVRVAECALEHTPGTLQSSKTSSQVLDPLMPSLSSFCAVENPGIPYKTYIHLQTKTYFTAMILFHLQFTKKQSFSPKQSKTQTSPKPQVTAVVENNRSELDRRYLFNNKSRDAPLIGVRVCLGVNYKNICIWAICDPELVAIQNIVVTWEKI